MSEEMSMPSYMEHMIGHTENLEIGILNNSMVLLFAHAHFTPLYYVTAFLLVWLHRQGGYHHFNAPLISMAHLIDN